MEAKHVICFEFEKEDRMYRLEMPNAAPLGEAYEAASTFLAEVVRLINEHAENSRSKEGDEAIDADPVEAEGK